MGGEGVEPSILSECASKAHAYASSATRPYFVNALITAKTAINKNRYHKNFPIINPIHPAGVEPATVCLRGSCSTN